MSAVTIRSQTVAEVDLYATAQGWSVLQTAAHCVVIGLTELEVLAILARRYARAREDA